VGSSQCRPPCPRIIFACKSNTCRSQMAEAWAKDWLAKSIRQNRLSLASLITQDSCTPGFSAISEEQHINYATALVASASIGKSSVFEEANTVQCETTCSDGICYISATAAEGDSQTQQRKTVKWKAIQAMKELGVEMENCRPKTLHEVMTGSQSKLHSKAEKIIIMCDCKIARDETNQYGESCEEWDIDPPTAAEKGGEVHAYRRVSLEIKRDVDRLMEHTFLCDTLQKVIL
jgi:protein-tyrosine-phosphatase